MGVKLKDVSSSEDEAAGDRYQHAGSDDGAVIRCFYCVSQREGKHGEQENSKKG